MKTWLAAAGALFLLASAGQSLAADPATPDARRQALAERVFRDLRVEDSFHAHMQAMSANLMKALPTGGALSDSDKALMGRAMLRGAAAIWPEYRQRVVAIYAESYGADELEAIAAFYESPVGRKMAEQNVAMAPKLGHAMVDLTPRMLEAMRLEYCDHKDDSPLGALMCNVAGAMLQSPKS